MIVVIIIIIVVVMVVAGDVINSNSRSGEVSDIPSRTSSGRKRGRRSSLANLASLAHVPVWPIWHMSQSGTIPDETVWQNVQSGQSGTCPSLANLATHTIWQPFINLAFAQVWGAK